MSFRGEDILKVKVEFCMRVEFITCAMSWTSIFKPKALALGMKQLKCAIKAIH